MSDNLIDLGIQSVDENGDTIDTELIRSQSLDAVKKIVKSRIGISSTVRDAYLEKIIEGVVDELNDINGLNLDINTNTYHVMFVADFSAWRYQNRDTMEGMPRHLQFRLHNLMVKGNGD